MLPLLLALSAHAWDLEPQASILLPQEDAPAALVHRSGPDVLALATSDEVHLVDVLDPEVLEILELPGVRAILGIDLDESGEDDLLLCTDAALYAVTWGEEVGEPVLVRDQGCVALGSHEVFGSPGVAVHGSSGTELWEDLADEEPALVDVVALSRPQLAAAGSSLGVAGVGEWTVRRVHSAGVEVLDAGGAVAGLTGIQGALAWSLGQEAQVVVGDTALDTDPHPGALAAADLDGDGEPHLVVGYPAALGLWDEGVEVQTVSMGMEPTRLLVGDLDGDGCEDLVVVGEELLTPWLVEECEDEPVDTGEPDPEGCGGAAQMLTGVAGVADEGEYVIVVARPSGCAPPDGVISWSVEAADLVVCEEDGWSLNCGLLDDGTVTVSATLRTARGAFLCEGTEVLEVDNRAPVLIGTDTLYWDSIEGEDFTWQLEATDVPADTITWELATDPPEGLEVSPDGVVTWASTQEGWWWFELAARDEDGGTTWVEAEMYVYVDGDARRSRGLRRIVGMCLLVFAAAVAMVLIVLLGRPASLV